MGEAKRRLAALVILQAQPLAKVTTAHKLILIPLMAQQEQEEEQEEQELLPHLAKAVQVVLDQRHLLLDQVLHERLEAEAQRLESVDRQELGELELMETQQHRAMVLPIQDQGAVVRLNPLLMEVTAAVVS